MTRHAFILALSLAALLVPLTGCETQPRYGEVGVRDRDFEARVVFSDRDRVLIREYYAPPRRGLPPGLAKKGKVPPGHAMRLNRGHAVPPDYRWQSMPHELEHRLSRLPEGYVRVIIGADIGIMNVRTRVVMDVMEDIAD